MAPLAVVEVLEVLEDLALRDAARRPSRAVRQFDLQRREEALGHSAVPAVAAPAHAAEDAVDGEQPLVVGAPFHSRGPVGPSAF